MVDTPPWFVEFYESRTEGCPVRDFLLGLDVPRRAKLVAIIRLLEEQGPNFPFPYSSQKRRMAAYPQRKAEGHMEKGSWSGGERTGSGLWGAK